MMEYSKYRVLISIVCLVRQCIGCSLVRDENNPYPFLLKLAVNGKVWCHSLLLTPKHVLSPYERVDFFVDAKEFSRLRFTGQRRGPYGRLLCVASRRPKHAISTEEQGRNMVFWRMEKPFDVAPNHPFLFTRLKDITHSAMRKNFNDTFDSECCTLPRFDSNSYYAKASAGFITLIRGNMSVYWANLFCKNDPSCIKSSPSRRFFAYDPQQLPPKANWHVGTVIICNNNSLGMLSSVMTDSDSHHITVFELFIYAAKLMHAYAVKEWPGTRTNDTTPTESGPPNMKIRNTAATICTSIINRLLCFNLFYYPITYCMMSIFQSQSLV